MSVILDTEDLPQVDEVDEADDTREQVTFLKYSVAKNFLTFFIENAISIDNLQDVRSFLSTILNF